MKETILSCLRKAGAKGMTVAEIAAEIEVLKSRVQTWFSTTGRKSREIEKVAEGRWRIVGKEKG